jgi:hypothetical protein
MATGYRTYGEEKRPWREIANDLVNEQETEKIIELSKELNDSLLDDQGSLAKAYEDS